MFVKGYKIEPRADLSRADLSGANLSWANLSGADLSGANLFGAKLPEGVPIVPSIDTAILEALKKGGTLDMGHWHSCETTHCRAGWATHLAGEAGKALEDKFGPNAAGALIYAASRPNLPVPSFFNSAEDSLKDIRKCAAGEAGTKP